MEPKEIIKLARAAKRLKQEDVANGIGISHRMYQRYEEGKFPKFKSNKIQELDRYLDTNIYDLLYDKKTAQSGIDQSSADFLAGQLAMAERLIAKLEENNEEVKADKDKLFEALAETRQTINELLKPMVTSLKEIPPVLDAILRNSSEHDREIMTALDHLVGNTPGTLQKEAGKRILKSAVEQQRKGKAEAGK